MWKILAKFILRFRILLMLLILAFTAFMGYKAKDVDIQYIYAPLLPESDSASAHYAKFKNYFGDDGRILVVGLKDDKLFECNKLNDFAAVGDSISKLTGVTGILSPAHVFNLVKNKKEKRFEAKKLFTHKVTDQKEMDSLSKVFHSMPFYEGLLYNDTSKVYVMAITMSKEVLDSKYREVVMDSIEHITQNFAHKYDVKLHYSGLPYTRTRVSQKVKKELSMFIALALAITALIIFIFFRQIKIVAACMTVVAIGVIWVFGTLVLLGYKITLLTGVIPPLLIVIGVPNCIFLLNKYHNEYKRTGNQSEALILMVRKIGNATFLTNLTTASGFITFIFTSSSLLKEFGLVASLNIMGIFILSLILVPSIFSFLAPPQEKQTQHLKNKGINKAVEKLCVVAGHHRKKTYSVFLVIILLAAFGISKIKSTGYIVDDIPHNDPIFVDLKFFEKHFGGLMPIEIIVDAKKKKGVMRRRTLVKINQLQDSLKKYKELSPSLAVTNGAKFMRQAYFKGKEKHYKLPSSQEQAFIFSYLKRDSDKSNMFKSFIDSTGQITRISLKVADVGTDRMKELYHLINGEVAKIFKDNRYDVRVTGVSVIYFKGTRYLLESLFTSLFLAICLIAVFMAVMFTSLRMVIVSLIPNLLPLVITAALMGYFGITIKPSTILVFSIAFGISVDDTIHFLAKYRQALSDNNKDIGKSVFIALRETGVSMIYTSIVLFFGFGVFAASSFGGTVALGILVSVTLLVAMLTNLILLPSLLLSLEQLINRKKAKKEIEK